MPPKVIPIEISSSSEIKKRKSSLQMINSFEIIKRKCLNYDTCHQSFTITSNFLFCEKCRKELPPNVNELTKSVTKICSKHPHEKYFREYISDNKELATCFHDRVQNRMYDKRRTNIEERRILYGGNLASIKSRAMDLYLFGPERQREKNRKNSERYRRMNPERMKIFNEQRKNDINYKFNYYKKEAEIDGKNWNLTFDQCEEFFTSECFYCGQQYEGYGFKFTGIDRLDSKLGYTEENCVPCCTMCNYIKGCLLADYFINICDHILTYHGIIKGELNYKLFIDFVSINYTECKNRAKNANIAFNLSEKQFHLLKAMRCYMCGKLNNEYHVNGIDRINSKNEYHISNCRACCATCNYIKNNYSLNDLLVQMVKIVKHCKYVDLYKINCEDNKQYNHYNQQFASNLITTKTLFDFVPSCDFFNDIEDESIEKLVDTMKQREKDAIKLQNLRRKQGIDNRILKRKENKMNKEQYIKRKEIKKIQRDKQLYDRYNKYFPN